MQSSERVSLYFVASPLQYLAAKRIAETFEPNARQVLVWYKPGLKSIVKAEEWSACVYLPWPRLEPLPGLFGRHRRLRANIQLVANLVGNCKTLIIHSAVFDTEAINYFLCALPRLCGAGEMRARILPDGLISIRRYTLTLGKRVLQHTRKMRRLFAPELSYQCFSGDRIGSDAAFCDRIYVLPSLPNEYQPEKVCVLPPLVDASNPIHDKERSERCALVIGQPLVDTRLLKEEDMHAITERIGKWLINQGITKIHYKAHPKDPRHELRRPDYHLIEPAEALETYLASHYYDAVVGVRSTALLFARQIYPPSVAVTAFGWDRIHFKSNQEQADMRRAFESCGVQIA